MQYSSLWWPWVLPHHCCRKSSSGSLRMPEMKTPPCLKSGGRQEELSSWTTHPGVGREELMPNYTMASSCRRTLLLCWGQSDMLAVPLHLCCCCCMLCWAALKKECSEETLGGEGWTTWGWMAELLLAGNEGWDELGVLRMMVTLRRHQVRYEIIQILSTIIAY